MKPIYNEDGQITDYSDEGVFVSQLEEEAEVSLSLDKLTKKQREVAVLILKGLSYKEIAKRLKTTEGAIKQMARRIRYFFSPYML